MAKYLDSNGLLYLWGKIKTTFLGDVSYDTSTRKLSKTKNGATSDLVTLSTVATSGSYNDLSNKPTIPTVPSAYTSNPAMDGTASAGSSTQWAKGDHVHPSDTSRAPVGHASSSDTYGKGTSSNYGHVKLSDATDGTSAAAGGGTAATPKAVSDALQEAYSYADSAAGDSNQNAFSNVKIGSTTIAADTETDTLELVAGSNITLTPDSTNDKITIAATDTAYAPFDGATSQDDGTEGLVPAPNAGEESFVLKGDGGWSDIGDVIAAAADESSPSGFVQVEGLYDAATGGSHVVISALEAADIPSLPASKIGSGTLSADRIPGLNATKITDGTLKISRGGTGASSLGTGIVYHSSDNAAALSIASASDIVSALGATAVNRATSDSSGNKISTTYAPKASPALTGTPTAPTAAAGTNTTQIATTAFVADAVGTASAGALQYKGAVTAESAITGAAYKKGWYWIVAMPSTTPATTSITIGGIECEAGDMVIAKQDKTSTLANDIDVIQSNIAVITNAEIDAIAV